MILSAKSQPLPLFYKESLLSQKICDLNLHITPGSLLEKCIKKLYKELQSAGFTHFKPKIYLGDEWFTPAGTSAISIPFYLADHDLKKLEKITMGYVQGGNQDWCMRLLRHEAGHCFEHAFKLSKTAQWKALFGRPSKKYDPHRYEADPSSKDFVENLELYYAQSHPEEDFAETFAVWLDPKSNWRNRYKYRPLALAKLYYVDKMVKELSKEKPQLAGRSYLPGQAKKSRTLLRSFYEKRIKLESSL